MIQIENDNLTDCRDSEKRKLSQADTNPTYQWLPKPLGKATFRQAAVRLAGFTNKIFYLNQ